MYLAFLSNEDNIIVKENHIARNAIYKTQILSM